MRIWETSSKLYGTDNYVTRKGRVVQLSGHAEEPLEPGTPVPQGVPEPTDYWGKESKAKVNPTYFLIKLYPYLFQHTLHVWQYRQREQGTVNRARCSLVT